MRHQRIRISLSFLMIFSLLLSTCDKDNSTKVKKDTSPPTVTIVTPEQGDILNGSVNITVTATDQSTIEFIDLALNGSIIKVDSSNALTYTWMTTEWEDGNYLIRARAYDKAANIGIDTISVTIQNNFTLKLYNRIFTPIDIDLVDHAIFTIPPFDSTRIHYSRNPETISYSASTSGKTDSKVIGKILEWSVSEYVGDVPFVNHDLEIDSSLFFIYVQNNSSHFLYPFYVNYDSEYETQDDILILPDSSNTSYPMGYYRAFENTEVRAYFVDNPTLYRHWRQGTDFHLPFRENQFAILRFHSMSKTANGQLSEVHAEIPAKVRKDNRAGYYIQPTKKNTRVQYAQIKE